MASEPHPAPKPPKEPCCVPVDGEQADRLFERIVMLERFYIGPESKPGFNTPGRAWVLDTWAECARATQGIRP
jgi:hypothetical protein